MIKHLKTVNADVLVQKEQEDQEEKDVQEEREVQTNPVMDSEDHQTREFLTGNPEPAEGN